MGRIGGDSDLSPRGRKYAIELPKLIHEHLGNQSLTVREKVSLFHQHHHYFKHGLQFLLN